MRRINYNEAIIDKEEIKAVCEFMKSGKYLAYSEQIIKAEKKLSKFLGVKYSLLVNSGSSANLLAFMALTSHKLTDRQRIKRGDEVITLACGFPTTISPIIQFGAVPVFIDIDILSLNAYLPDLKKAISNKTKAVILPHTLGNPFAVDQVKDFCDRHSLWLIEDNCDALGGEYKGRLTGTWGDLGTSSFYPAHHITNGEGGAVYTDNEQLYRIMQSFRDWGRDYKCLECQFICENRFNNDYDCRYEYSHFGYNLKVTEIQGIFLQKQLDKLPLFIQKRRQNWKKLRIRLKEFYEYFLFQKQDLNANPSWFSFFLCINKIFKGKNYNRNDFIQYLEKNGIGCRVLFAGNILKHICMKNLQEEKDYRVIGDLKNTNYVMENGFFIGCHPKMTDEDIKYIYEKFKEYLK